MHTQTPNTNPENAVEMTKEELRALLAFAAKDRADLAAVSFARRGDALYLVATDGHALAMFPARGDAPCSRTRLARAVLDDAVRLAKKDSRIVIQECSGRWTVRVDDVAIPCPIQDTVGTYPDVWAIECPAPREGAPPVPAIACSPNLLARVVACAKAEGKASALMLAPGDASKAFECHAGRFRIAVMPLQSKHKTAPVRHFTGRSL